MALTEKEKNKLIKSAELEAAAYAKTVQANDLVEEVVKSHWEDPDTLKDIFRRLSPHSHFYRAEIRGVLKQAGVDTKKLLEGGKK